MPDFDKNLNPILANTQKALPVLDNPATPVPSDYAPLTSGGNLRQAEVDPIFGKGPVVSKMLPTVSAAELYGNRRYATYDANIIDIEDQKAYAQSNLDKATNGVLKGLNLAATTVAGGFGMLYGAAKAPFSGRLADIWDNEVMRGLDEYNNEVDQNWLPNYYTNVEKNAAWYSTDNWFKTNFLFDKLIKNSGFAVGAMLSGNIANAALKGTGAVLGGLAAEGATAAEASQAFKIFTPLLRNTARAFSSGKNIEAAAILEREISSIADVTTKASELAKIAQTTNQFSKFGEAARRTAIAVYSSAGESSFEALQAQKQFRDNLIQQWKDSHNGEDPIGEDLNKIDKYSESVGKTSFLANLAVLGITEYAQLPKLIGSSYSAEKQAANSLLGQTEEVLLKEGKYITKPGPKTLFGKIIDRSGRVSKYVFDPKEAFQESVQQIVQTGTQNYYNKAYQSKAADVWVDGFLHGAVGENEKGEGVGAFNSKEGWESFILGGLTGGLMQARGNIREARALKSNTQQFVDGLNNAPTFRDSFKDRLASANRGVVLQEQQQNAIMQGDKLEAMDLNADMMHNYLAPRIKYGRFDMVMEDLQELRQNGGTDQGLASLKQQGLANINDTVQSYQKRLSNFERVAKNTEQIYKSTNLRFSGQIITDEKGIPVLDENGKQQRKYSPAVIDKIVYAASKVADYDLRIPEVSTTALNKGIDVQSIIDSELSSDSSTALASQLNELDKNGDPISTPDVKQSLKDVVEMSLRRRQFLDEYREMTDNPGKFDETGERKEFNEEGKKFRTTPTQKTKGGKNWQAQSRLPFKGDKRTYDDLVSQYGEGEQSKYEVLKKITESPFATTMEKELAAQFMKYTDRNSKIILGDRTLNVPGISKTNLSSPTASVSTINYEYNSDDYEGVTMPVEYVMLHEIGHDLTVYALLDKSDPFHKELEPLFKFVQEHFKNDENKYANNGLLKNGEFYAFKDIEEFATEALSNRDFQRYLDTIPYKNTQRSVWENFVDNLKTFFRRLFGINSDSALDEVVGIVTNNIDRVYKSQKEQNNKLTEEEAKAEAEALEIKKDSEKIEKQITQIELASGDNGTPEEEVGISSIPEGKLKSAAEFFAAGTSETEKEDVSQDATHVRNSREFLNNAKNFKNRENLRAFLVTPNQEKVLGLEGLTALSYNGEDMSQSTNVDEGLVAQVFIEQDGGKNYFIDKNGERLGEVGQPVDVSKVIFQTMPTTDIYYKGTDKDGNRIPRFRTGEKEAFEAYSKAWRIKREQLFKDAGTTIKTYKFNISRGIAIETPKVNGKYERNHVGDIVIPENKISRQQGLVIVPVDGNVYHQGKNIQFPKGTPVIQYGDTLFFLKNAVLGKEKAQNVYQVIKAMSDEFLKTKDINPKYAEYLQNVLYLRTKGAVTKAGSNQMFIDAKSAEIFLGGKRYAINDIANREKEITEQLTNTYHNTNNFTLSKKFSAPFYEFTYKDGSLQEIEWKNYQSYLLASKNPDGSARNTANTPLTTTLDKPSTLRPYSFKQKYATLIDFEFPVVPVVKPAPAVTATTPTATDMLGTFKMDGKTKNTFTEFNSGPVDFTGTVDKDGNISVEVIQNDTINKVAKNDKLLNEAIIPALKASNAFDPSADDIELVSTFVANKLVLELKKLQQAAPAAPAVQPTATQTVEDKIKSIESRIKTLNEFIGNTDSNAAIVASEKQIAELEKELKELKKSQATVTPAPTAPVSNKELENKIKALPDSVYNDTKNTGLFLDVIIDKTKDNKKGADVNQEGFVVNFSGVDSKDDIKLTINSLSKEGDNYRIIGKGGIGAKAATYNFLVSSSGDILSITSAEGKTFSGETNANIRPTEAIRKSIQSTSNKDLIYKLASLSTAPVSDIEAKKADIERRRQEELKDAIGLNLTAIDLSSPQLNVNAEQQMRIAESERNNYTAHFIGSIIGKLQTVKGFLEAKKENKKVPQGFDTWEIRAEETLQEANKEYKNIVESYIKKGLSTDNKLIANIGSLLKGNKINAKYDAELAALEGKPAEAPVSKVQKIDPYESVETLTKVLNDIDDQTDTAFWHMLNGQVGSRHTSNESVAKMYFKNKDWRDDKGRPYFDILEIEKVVKEYVANKPTEPGKYNPNNTSAPDDEYQRVGVDVGEERLTDAEIAAFKEFHAQNAPGLPFEVLDNIITTHDNKQAFGVFQNGLIKFYKGGLKSTPYHELGEGIWKAFLTPEQRQAILDQERASGKDFVDRETGKTLNYATATDKQIKERIMDDFGLFQAGKIRAKSLSDRILEFFRNIINFFKTFGQKPSLKDELFKAIESGKFKDFKVSDVVRADSMAEYSRIPGLTETQKFEYVQDMLSRAANYIFGQNKRSLYDISKITSNELFDYIKGFYERENKYQELGEERWQMLVTKTKQALRTFGINFNEDERIDINDENVSNKEYTSDPFTTDWKKSSPFAIKITLATLPEVLPKNQQHSDPTKLPERRISSIKGYLLNNFSRAFATVLNKLSNTSKVSKAVSKLAELSNEDPTYKRFFQRLGGNIADGTINFNELKTPEDWRLFVNMMQVFTKQKPDAVIQYMDGGSVYTAPANQFTAAKQIEQGWYDNMKALARVPKSIIKYSPQTKTYNVNLESPSFPKASPKIAEQMVSFLNDLGIGIDMNLYNSMKDKQKKDFSEAVGQIYAYIKETKEIGTITGKTLGINSQLAKLSNMVVTLTNPNQENTFFGVEGKRIQAYSDNNLPSVFENEFNEASTLKELVKERPELNDVFSKNSVILKEGGEFFNEEGDRIKSLKVSYIQGTKNLNNNKGTTTAKLTLGNRFTQELNQNLNGNYYVLVPADSSTEWMINLGNHISFSDVASGRAVNKINKIFKGYLIDDIALALDGRNQKNVGNKSKELRFFKDFLSEKDVNGEERSEVLLGINEMIEQGRTLDDITEFISEKENAEMINNAIQKFINDTVAESKQLLSENGETFINVEDKLAYPNLNNDFTSNKDVNINKNAMTEKNLDDVLFFANANYIMNNIEMHKLLFGDPYQFAVKKDGSLDETKRIKSFLSPRRTTFDSPEFNTFLNNYYNTVDNIELEEGELGYHNHDSFTNTVTIADTEASTELYPENFKVADAASWLKDNTYREVKLKNGQWSTEAENWHQWQMAYTRQNLPGYEYKSEALKKRDEKLVKTPEPEFVTEILKPIVSGVKADSTNINLVLDKFSQMPLYYKAVQGTNLGKLYEKMWKENVGYVIMESGRKVGAVKLHNLYNEDGTFNEQPFAQDTMVKVPWKSYGIQVENSFENPKDQTRGSQLTKLSSLDLFNNGEASEDARREYQRNKNVLDKMHENAYNELLNKLGIEDLGTSFKMVDPSAISKTLEGEMLRRAMSENGIDTIQLNEDKQFPIPFEASPVYQQIRSILYSMVNKSLISPKVNGAPHVQVPVTMWEKSGEGRGLAIKEEKGYRKITSAEYNALSADQKKKVVMTDRTLKFYEKDKNGNVQPCEIMLPHWFKERLNKKRFPNDEALLKYLNGTPEGKSILRGIGFRIPTQAMSSTEVFIVKGFLPKSMGYSVVVPAEITAKTGSDFDIDKLNMYLKSTYIDKNGDIRLVRLMEDEAKTKEFFSGVFDEKLEKKKVNKAELLEATQILAYGLEDPNNLVDKYADILDPILEGAEDSSEYEQKVMDELSKLGDANLQSALKEKFVKNMYKKALENEYYDSLEKMILLPENFDRLVAPIGDGGLKNVAKKLDKLRNEDESKIVNRLLNRNYMTSLRNSFVMAKKWVGIAAVNITGQSVTQKSKVYIDPAKFELVSKFDREILGDGKILLPHNTIKIGENEYISISGNKTADGKEYISDRLSGYATAFVDVAKDPYIMKIIRSNSIVSTFMFLERIGAGEKAIEFLNQPIITEYLKYIDSIGKTGLFSKMDGDVVRAMFPTTSAALASTSINMDNLTKNIEDYANQSLTPEQNAEQQKIFNEFLKYAKMAQYNFKLTQATNYDTTKFTSGDTMFRKKYRTIEAQKTNIFSSVSKILNSTFMGQQAKLIDKSMEGMGAILKLEQPEIRDITDQVLEKYASQEYMSDDDYEKMGNKIKASFLDYVIQIKSGINNDIKTLLVDSTSSIDVQLAEAKKKYPEMKLLKELTTESSQRMNGAKTIKLMANNRGDAMDENMYIEMMRELKEVDIQLYNNIVTAAILQGTYQSSVSIRNIIPIEDFSARIAPIINKLANTEDVKAFSKGAFQRNNWKDETVVPTLERIRFIPMTDQNGNELDPVGEQVDKYGDHVADIYRYVSPMFPDQILNTKSIERKILKLHPNYYRIAIDNDFIKVPRVITSTKDNQKVDMVTGLTITDQSYKDRKAKNDLSLYDYFGYEKVKDELGNPLVTENGEYIYKLINLYGDGQYASEYHLDGQPSPIDNGTIKIDNEIPNKDLFQYFAPKVEEKVLPSQPVQQAPTAAPVSEESKIETPVPGVENISNSGLTVEQSNQFIDILQPQILNQAYVENKAKTANMMFSFGLRWAKNIPNESEKSEQAKNLGKPRPNRKAIKSKEGMTYGYYTTDQNNQALPSIKELQPIMDFIQSKLGIDMSNYDAMLGNIYDDSSFIHQHRDTTESVTAEGYPVIVLNLGANGHLEYDKDVKSTYASYKKSGQLDLANGGIYAFGINGENRFTFHHRIGSGLESANPLNPLTLPNGQTLTNYRITLTFRRASDLEQGMSKSPERISQPTQTEKLVTSAKISTPSGKLKLKDGKEYLISDINSELLKSIGYKPAEIGKLLKSIC